MADIQKIDGHANLLRAILWQYSHADKLKALAQAKQDWRDRNIEQFWSDWYRDVFNINTANDFGLAIWGKILGIPITVDIDPSTGREVWGFGPGATFVSRASIGTYFDIDGILRTAGVNVARYHYNPLTHDYLGLLVEDAATNLALQSGNISNAYWASVRASVSTVAPKIAPDGSPSFYKLVEDTTANNTHSVGRTVAGTVAGQTVTSSWYVLKDTRTACSIRCAGSAFIGRARFDLDAGTVIANDAAITPSITPIGGGVYRISATFITDSTSTVMQLELAIGTNVSYTGDRGFWPICMGRSA